ncbi:hypothetical protein [Ralstonia sp. UNC404CL21Col]|uniref:hypothetical protein n=1 Tax=Ralstonia sp. UNC404CL21Col TaxID=1380362 RepID=UPI0012DCA78E|nr:hypothetical protein [Ralstonia sp. UNC404CL21Col]
MNCSQRRRWKHILIVGAISCLLLPGSASALSQFSRACQFSKIPETLQDAAHQLFILLGASKSTFGLPYRVEKRDYWINESITVDWLEARYYLFSASTPYIYTKANGFVKYIDTRYSRWAAQRPNDDILSDNKLRILMANRGLLYSARAGRPDIYDNIGYDAYIHGPSIKMDVVGDHWVYDPKEGRSRPLPRTRAQTCNLTEWGFEQR